MIRPSRSWEDVFKTEQLVMPSAMAQLVNRPLARNSNLQPLFDHRMPARTSSVIAISAPMYRDASRAHFVKSSEMASSSLHGARPTANPNIRMKASGVPFGVPVRSSSCSALQDCSPRRGLLHQRAHGGEISPCVKVSKNQTEGIFSKFLNEFANPQCLSSDSMNGHQSALPTTQSLLKESRVSVDVDKSDAATYFSPPKTALLKQTIAGAREHQSVDASLGQFPLASSYFKSMSSAPSQQHRNAHANPSTSSNSDLFLKASLSTPRSTSSNFFAGDLSRYHHRRTSSVVSNIQVRPLLACATNLSSEQTSKSDQQTHQNVSTGCQSVSSSKALSEKTAKHCQQIYQNVSTSLQSVSSYKVSSEQTPAKSCQQTRQKASTSCQSVASIADTRFHGQTQMIIKPNLSNHEDTKIVSKLVPSRTDQQRPGVSGCTEQKMQLKERTIKKNQTNNFQQMNSARDFKYAEKQSINSVPSLHSSKSRTPAKPSSKCSSGMPSFDWLYSHVRPVNAFRPGLQSSDLRSSSNTKAPRSSFPASTGNAGILRQAAVGSHNVMNISLSSRLPSSGHHSQQSVTSGLQRFPCFVSSYSSFLQEREADSASDSDEMPDIVSTRVQSSNSIVESQLQQLPYESAVAQLGKGTHPIDSTSDDEMPDITSAPVQGLNPMLDTSPSKPLRFQPKNQPMQAPQSQQKSLPFTLILQDEEMLSTDKIVQHLMFKSREELEAFMHQLETNKSVMGTINQPSVSSCVEGSNKSILGKRIGRTSRDRQNEFEHKVPERKKSRKIDCQSSDSNDQKNNPPLIRSSCSNGSQLSDNMASWGVQNEVTGNDTLRKLNTKKCRGFQSVFEDFEMMTKLTGEAESEFNDTQNTVVCCNDGSQADEIKKKRKSSKFARPDLHTARRDHHGFSLKPIAASLKSAMKQRSNVLLLKGKTFIQRQTCLAKQLRSIPPCLECRKRRVNPRGGVKAKYADHQCRFLAFRRLRIGSNGKPRGCGFLSPSDALTSELSLWLPPSHQVEPFLSQESALYIIKNAGSGFCDLIEQEKAAMAWIQPETTVAWKQAVEGVREMCDSCCTTVFNMHWTCSKCGHAICLDCFKSVLECQTCASLDGASAASPSTSIEDSTVCAACTRILQRCCVSRKLHGCSTLMPTSVIPSDALLSLGNAIHEVRRKFKLKDGCPCGANMAEESSQLPVVNDSPKALTALETESQSLPTHRQPCSSCSTSGTSECCAERDSVGDPRKPLEKASGVVTHIVNSRTIKQTSTGDDGMLEAGWRVKALKSSLITHHTSVAMPVLSKEVLINDSTVAPHAYLDNGRLLQLLDPSASDNLRMFRARWSRSAPVVVSNCQKKLDSSLWSPESFSAEFGDRVNDLVDCARNRILVGHEMRHFWDGFECIEARLRDRQNQPMILKLKDWPSTEDFADSLPSRFNDLLGALPLHEYTDRKGVLNLASRLPSFFVRPDLGPKMYTAYGSALTPSTGSTNLHLDISDAVNMMVYVGIPHDDFQRHSDAAMVAIEEAGCCELSKKRVTEGNLKPGALWHIFDPHDSNKIRELLRKVGRERNEIVEPNTDPIHDQSWYLDEELRRRLLAEYGVRGYTILQCLGDAIFIPAGAPHQVRNLHSCIKAAEDFVSPENLHYCFRLTQEFRYLSDTHTNHEDKLQVKNIIYHTVKDAVSVLLHG